MTPDILGSSALSLLRNLKRLGCRIELASDRLIVEPASRLTDAQRAAVRAHARELAVLVRCSDDGVKARRDVFRQQLEAAPFGTVPAFVFRNHVPYVRGACFSCGDGLPEPRFSRCWRCSLAWRLVCGLLVATDFTAAMDGARVA